MKKANKMTTTSWGLFF